MTREEIEELKGLAASMGLYDDKNPCKRAVILGKAIKTLEQEPCDDAINRQAVLDKKELVELEDGQSFYCISPEDVKALQPVTPQPKTGHWMIVKGSIDLFFATYECSCCKRAIIVPHDAMKAVYKDYPYCHCGAKMQEVEE